MGYNDLSSNQIVSGANLQDAVDKGILIQKSQITRGSQEITKTFLGDTTYVNPNNSYYSTSGSTQLMAKRAITPTGSQRIVIASYDGAQFPTIQLIQSSINGGASWSANESAAAFTWQQLEATPNGLKFIGSSGLRVYFGSPTGSVSTFDVSYDIYDFVSGVGISDDGNYLYAASGSVHYTGDSLGQLWRSINGGGSWESCFQVTLEHYISAVGCSGNGQYVCAFRKANDTYSANSALYYNSGYGGGTWEFSLPTFLQATTANYCVISYTGQYILVVTGDPWNNNYRICVNNNYGQFNAWTVTTIAWIPYHCAISGDGRCMAVSAYNQSTVYTSTDYGVNWSTSTPAGGTQWTAGVAVSFDGNLFAALGTGGNFATSTNGTSWTAGTNPGPSAPQWSGIAM